MRLGILADIHEDNDRLEHAVDLLHREGVDQFVVLGDIFETGRQIDETVSILKDIGAVGVWGNHDLGLCHNREPWIFEHFSPQVVEFFATLTAKLEISGAVFTHGALWWDATDPTVYYLCERPDEFQDCFDRFNGRLSFVGHFHRWLVAIPGTITDWDGTTPVKLARAQRYQIIIHAVMNGWCALFDTENEELVPHWLG